MAANPSESCLPQVELKKIGLAEGPKKSAHFFKKYLRLLSTVFLVKFIPLSAKDFSDLYLQFLQAPIGKSLRLIFGYFA